MRLTTAFLLATLMLLCAGVGIVLAPSVHKSEQESLFLACFSGGVPIYMGEIRGAPDISDDSMTFFSVEHGTTIKMVGASCMMMRPST